MQLQHRCPVRPLVSLQRIKRWRITEREGELQVVFKAAVNGASSGDVNTKWSWLERAITEGAGSPLGITRPGIPFIKRESWWCAEEIQDIIKMKKVANKKQLELNLDENMQEYREAKPAAKRAISAAKEVCYNDMHDELDPADGEKKIYRIAKARQRATEDLGHVIQVRDKSVVCSIAFRAFLTGGANTTTTCNVKFPHPQIPSAIPVFGPVPLILEGGIADTVAKMRDGRSPGPDDLLFRSLENS